MDTRIYVCAHKVTSLPKDPLFFPLQVGASLHEDLGPAYVKDNTGDNISGKNPHYCELTGLYWVWKNVSCDVVGICHYRRYFSHYDQKTYLLKDEIESLLKDADILLPISQLPTEPTLWSAYAHDHVEKDLKTLRDVIRDLTPDYLPAFDQSMSCRLLSVGNMMIMRKDLYDAYCSWLFTVLKEVEKRTDLTGYDSYQTRIYGFLSERMTRVYALCHGLKVREVPFMIKDPGDDEKRKRVADLKEAEASAFLKPYVMIRKAGKDFSVLPDPGAGLDFQGKIPVWMVLSGGDPSSLPLREALSLGSLIKYLSDDFALYPVDKGNPGQYLRLPDWVLTAGLDEAETLSLIESGLLYAYGGLFMTPDFLLSRPLFGDFFREKEAYFPAPGLAYVRPRADRGTDKAGRDLLERVLSFFWNSCGIFSSQAGKTRSLSWPDETYSLLHRDFPETKAFLDGTRAQGAVFPLTKSFLTKEFKGEKYKTLCQKALFLSLPPSLPEEDLTITGEKNILACLKRTYLKEEA